MSNYAIDRLRLLKPIREERQPNGPGITLTYTGLVVKGFLRDQGVIPDVITVSSRAWDIGDGLYIGMPFGQVKARFGRPTSVDGGTANYCLADGNCIRFTNRGGRLARFQYRFRP